MNRKLKGALWGLLVLSLALAFSGIYLRVSNESQNRTLITTADYYQFEKSADASNYNMDKLLHRMQDDGIKTMAVNEVTLRYLAYKGDVYISSFGDFSALTQTNAPSLWPAVEKAISGKKVNPVNLTVAFTNPEVRDFVTERLKNRFQSNQIISFSAGGKDYVIIAAELTALEKTKDASPQLDTRLGFDDNLLEKLKQMGFEIILRPGSTTGSRLGYMDEYNQTIQKYGVKTVIFGGTKVPGAPEDLIKMQRLVEKNHLLIGIIETSKQLQYIDQEGLDQLMAATGYHINRVYSTGNDDYLSDFNERYYRWMRAVIDRGIRIVYLAPFKDTSLNSSENLEHTLQIVKQFHSTIQEKGYTLNQPLPELSSEMTGPLHRFAVSLSLLFAGLLYLLYLFKPKRRTLFGLLILGMLACIGINLVLHMDFSKIYALAAAILYPSLSSLLLLLYLKKAKSSFLVQLLYSLGIVIGVNMMGAYTIVTSLSDIRYIMNVGIFSGVKLAFIMPLLLFGLNYLMVFADQGTLLKKTGQWLRRSPSYLSLFIGIAALGLLYYYLGRSGNTSGVTVSTAEIKLREILENLFLARPRFKEFLIGYPALFAMVYLYPKYKRNLILLVLGLCTVMGSISMVNSFSHVFTAVTISANRGLAGLLTGVIVGILVLIGIRIIEWLWGKYGVQS